jgi:hypothetical protein
MSIFNKQMDEGIARRNDLYEYVYDLNKETEEEFEV